MTAKKGIKIQYVRCDFGTSGLDLESGIRKALNRTINGIPLIQLPALERAMPLSVGQQEKLFCNDMQLNSRYKINQKSVTPVFGSLLSFTGGRSQAVLHDIMNKPNADVRQIAAGQNEEFIDGIGFFMVLKNHVLLTTTRQIRISDYEDYFSWLLTKRTNILNINSFIHFQNLFNQTKPLSVNDIKELKLWDKQLFGAVGQAQSTADGGRTKPRLFEILRNALNLQGATPSQNLTQYTRSLRQGTFSVNDLQLRTEIKISALRPGGSTDLSIISGILDIARTIDDIEISATLRNNTQIKGDKLVLINRKQLTVDDGLFNPTQVYSAMIEVLGNFTLKGLINL